MAAAKLLAVKRLRERVVVIDEYEGCERGEGGKK